MIPSIGPAHDEVAPALPQPGSRAFWAQPLDDRLDDFARLRREAPVTYHAEGLRRGDRPGFWSVTRHADIAHVSRNPEIFSSGRGFTMDDLSPEMSEVLGSMIALDDPRHAYLRRLVLQAFSARTVNGQEPAIRTRAVGAIDQLLEKGECDFVDVVAAPFPLQVICDLIGIPAEMEADLRRWTDEIVGVSDPDHKRAPGRRGGDMYQYALDLGAERRRRPRDDLASALMQAEIEGHQLTGEEFAAFMTLLIAAGNETTRTSLTWALTLLTRFPDQRAALWADFEARVRNASDEIVRWSTPVQHMRRTATVDTELQGVNIAAGDKVVMWYAAGNHDENVFPDPRRFDIGRSNAADQAGFGAGGPHYCIGAALARLEIRVLLDEIRQRAPRLHATAEPTLLLSAFANAVKQLPCAVG
ncbi:MAG: cytochrome [Pseudonocardiales bacterium]|nr:cytochrome [Pseudonocardiales bacterium]